MIIIIVPEENLESLMLAAHAAQSAQTCMQAQLEAMEKINRAFREQNLFPHPDPLTAEAVDEILRSINTETVRQLAEDLERTLEIFKPLSPSEKLMFDISDTFKDLYRQFRHWLSQFEPISNKFTSRLP